MGTLFLVPLLLQNGLGFSAIHSGLSTFTEAIGGHGRRASSPPACTSGWGPAAA